MGRVDVPTGPRFYTGSVGQSFASRVQHGGTMGRPRPTLSTGRVGAFDNADASAWAACHDLPVSLVTGTVLLGVPGFGPTSAAASLNIA